MLRLAIKGFSLSRGGCVASSLFSYATELSQKNHDLFVKENIDNSLKNSTILDLLATVDCDLPICMYHFYKTVC